ncbi:MAG: flavodoxin [Hominilimicola sp.]
MKKILSIILSLVFTLSMITGCNAADNSDSDFTLTMQIGNPVMTVNGTEKNIDNEGTAPVVQNDRTLVPVRAIIEEMGGSVTWTQETQTATLTYGNDTIDLIIGSQTAYLNGTANTLDIAPVIINERTMLPIRFIAESFKFNVDWEQETQTVIIKKSTSDNPSVMPTEQPTGSGKVLVVYYSASGNTEDVANYIAASTNADIFELEPVNPYTDADLNWTDENSRVVREHDNESERKVELKETTVADWESYDTVFIGYPIWWGIAAWPVNGFIEANDFTGKTVIPFCTSASSGLGESGKLLAEAAGTGNWQTGMRFRSGVSENDVKTWVESLDIKADTNKTESKSLVVYFSMPETTKPDNMTQEEDNSTVVINGEVLGNTQYMAYVIAENRNADIFRIEPQTPYPTNHSTLVDQASEEQKNKARPAIKERLENINDYDVVFLGYPNWWGDMPMILYTFLEQYDLSGKTVIPFNTHGGSGFSDTIDTIRTLQPNAKVLNGLSISRNHIQDAEQEIIDWVSGLEK